MNIFITQHAAERYRTRVDPTLAAHAVMSLLIRRSQTARKLQTRTRGGQEQWVAEDVVFICKVDPDGSRVAVTIGRYEVDDTVDQVMADVELDRQYWAAQRASEEPVTAPAPPMVSDVEVEVLQVAMAQRRKVIQQRLQHGAKEGEKAIAQLRRRQEKDEAKLRELRGQPKETTLPTHHPLANLVVRT